MPHETTISAHPPGLRPDDLGAKVGMWLFLFTEFVLFGGLFLIFSVYFHMHAAEFQAAGRHLNRVPGTVNTVVLLTGSLLTALSVCAVRDNRIVLARRYLLGTLGCTAIFLAIKALEWRAKIQLGLYPGGPEYLVLPPGQMAFFNLYYLMTGLHAAHVLAGGALIGWARHRIGKGLITAERAVILENIGLFWHLVDVVWIYLFPVFYLAL